MAKTPANQNKNEENIPRPVAENEDYAKTLLEVVNSENMYIRARRQKAADEFIKIRANEHNLTDAEYEEIERNEYKLTSKEYEKMRWYVELLGASPTLSETKAQSGVVRPGTIGMAFSGGGIRSSTFCLGVVQGLSRFGVLPWVDYLTSVSGGGFMASCMTSLLSHEEKQIKYSGIAPIDEEHEQRYYPFNAFWERFPFNPDLQVFDKEGVAYANKNALPIEEQKDAIKIHVLLKKANGKQRNRQLEHMRNLGNYLIPRMGLLTVDTIRGLGAFLLRIVYTLLVFLAAMLIISSIHYAVAAAFTPEIMRTFKLGQSEYSPSMLSLLFTYHQDSSFGDSEYPWGIYGKTLLAGLFLSYIMALIVSFSYRKDSTTENRYRVWELPSSIKKVSTYSRVVIRGIVLTAAFLMAILTFCSVYVWFFVDPGAVKMDFASAQGYFYFTLLILFGSYFLAGVYFLTSYVWEESWAEQGLPEQEWIDGLVTIMILLITFWTMILVLGWLKINEGFDGMLRIYWIWTPAIFMFGGGWGLILFQYTQQFLLQFGLITKSVKPPEVYDEESIFQDSFFRRGLLNKIARKYLEKITEGKAVSDERVSRWAQQKPYTFNIWSNPDFRSIFWTMQGLFMYGTLGFVLLGVILVPHYFSSQAASKTQAYVSLSIAVITGVWSNYLASSGKSQVFSWFTKIFSLPPELSQPLLAILVFLFNLSMLFLMEIGLDALPPFYPAWSAHWNFFLIALIAGVMLIFLGSVNINFLSAHYFFRDRLADAYLRTEVDDLSNHQENYTVGVPRDDRDRLVSRVQRGKCSAAYHIVMTTINLSGSWYLQFKDRKSQPFIFSKLYSGSDITGYVKTEKYRDNSTKYSQAIALSGAAVSSGLGYLTFFAQAFVITLFNLRLGLWMDNPLIYKKEEKSKLGVEQKKNDKPVDKHGPWLPYLWDEMRGRMSERRQLVNITDGAHTEDNIGLYPLFQRRCKYIIACDAGEDPEGKCAELVAAIRQANLDFGIKVDIDVEGLKPGTYDKEKNIVTESETHFAIGKIAYPQTTEYPEMTGWLIYFRPSVVKNDPAPILKYWQKHKLDFPHPSTVDQFFDEEQFEVVRQLGEWTVFSALKQSVDKFQSEAAKKRITKKKRLAYVTFLKKITCFDDAEEMPTVFQLPGKKFIGFEGLFEEYHRLTPH